MDESKFKLLCRFKSPSELSLSLDEKHPNSKLLTNSTYNNIYRLKLLMLLLYRGVSHKYNFNLSTEVKEAQKWYNLLFEYNEDGKKIYRILQVKHKLNETKLIAVDQLLENGEGDYSLIQFFYFYQKCKKDKLFKNGIIKDLIVCTNLNFDFANLEKNNIGVKKIEGKGDILHFTKIKEESVLFKFDDRILSMLEFRLLQKIQNQFLVDEIHDFLNHLVFAVNQPNEEELETIIKKELGKEFNQITTEHVYNQLLIQIFEWLQTKDKFNFLSYKDGFKFFEEVKKGIYICFDVLDPIKSFTGRNKQLKILHKMFKGKGENPITQTVCICGLGGIGKSELVRKYVADYSPYYDNKIVWINAESRQSLIDSFQSLVSEKLKINIENAISTKKDIISIVERAFDFFSMGKCLFIFDNAEKYKCQSDRDNGIEKFLPSVSCNKPSIIIISRNQKWPKNFKLLNLDVLFQNEAEQFIKKSLGIENDSLNKDIKTLSEKLQGFPLAIQQAVSYISAQSDNLKSLVISYEISNYIERYDNKIKELLDYGFLDQDVNIYCKMFATWNITLEAIREKDCGKYALEILYISSFVVADKIPLNLFNKYIKDEEYLKHAVNILKQYSFINMNAEKSIFNMHKLVQQFTKLKLKEENKEISTIKRILQPFVDESFLTSVNVKHAISVWIHASKHMELMEEFSIIPHVIACKLNNEKRYNEAYSFAIEAEKLLTLLPSMNLGIKENLALIRFDIARTLKAIGKYDDALKLLQHLYDSWIALQGPDTPMALVIKSEIITVNYYKTNNKEETALDYLKLIGISNLALGENHTVSLLIKNIYSKFLIKIDEHENLNDITKKTNNNSYITDEISDIPEIKDKVICMTNSSTAGVLFRQGKSDEALKLYQKTCEDYKKKFGRDDHPDILSIKNNMAYALIQTGDNDKALQLVKEVDINSGAENVNDSVMLSIRSNLGGLYYELGKYNEALNILQDTFDRQKHIHGPDHSNTVKTQSFLGATFYHQGNLKKALPIFQESLKRLITLKGNNHPETLDVRKGIADIYFNRKDYEQAYKCFIELLVLTEEIIGEENEKTNVVRSCIIKTLLELGNVDKALEEYDKVLRIQLKNCGPEHLDTLTTKNNIGMMLAREKQEYDKALVLLNEVVEALTKKLGPDHSQTIKAKGNVEQVIKLRQKSGSLQRTFSELSILPNNDLLIAVQKNKLTKVDILIKQGLNVNIKDNNHRTPLHRAINNNNIDIVNVLLKNGADVFQSDKKGNTPLHTAAFKGSCKIVEILLQNLERKKLIDLIGAKTTDGYRAIHMAVKSGSLDTVKCLLKYGASFDIANGEGKIPIDLSSNEKITSFLKLISELFRDVKKGDEKVIEKLNLLKIVESSVVTNTRNYEGKTLIQVAIINKQKSIASCILRLLKN